MVYMVYIHIVWLREPSAAGQSARSETHLLLTVMMMLWCFSHKLPRGGQDWSRFAAGGPISLPFQLGLRYGHEKVQKRKGCDHTHQVLPYPAPAFSRPPTLQGQTRDAHRELTQLGSMQPRPGWTRSSALTLCWLFQRYKRGACVNKRY